MPSTWGADEIDIVVTRSHVLQAEWTALYDEISAMREACGTAKMKAILATGDLKSLENVARASRVAMQAGSDWIKTSTGKEGVNATLPVSLVMCRAIRDYRDRTGHVVGFKPAGGLKTAKDALAWQVLMVEELGRDWCGPICSASGQARFWAIWNARSATSSPAAMPPPATYMA